MYCLVSLQECNAVGITTALIKSLKDDGLPLKHLCGIGVDGANTMVGEHNSVFTLLRQEAGEHLILNKCICHSLHLAASHATETLPRNLDYLVRETCSWFSYSHKRRFQYAELYKTLNDDKCPLKLSHLSATRWLARRDCIVKILDQWDALTLHFDLARNTKRCYTAEISDIRFLYTG